MTLHHFLAKQSPRVLRQLELRTNDELLRERDPLRAFRLQQESYALYQQITVEQHRGRGSCLEWVAITGGVISGLILLAMQTLP